MDMKTRLVQLHVFDIPLRPERYHPTTRQKPGMEIKGAPLTDTEEYIPPNMAEFVIEDKDLTGLEGKVVIVTGGSSGIGLATVETLLSQGASVVNADINPPAQQPEGSYTFVKTNVAVWAELVALFKETKKTHGRIDHVFANAGVGPRTDYLATEVDENGDLKEPSSVLLDVSLTGVINTTTLAMNYMREQPQGGSIVINGSSTGLQRLRAVDYATAKHAVLGFGRGLIPVLEAMKLPIRVNILAPTWTDSSVLPDLKGLMAKIGVELQPASAVARGAVLLMADESRNGHVIHVQCSKYKEIDEAVLLPAFKSILGPDYPSEDEVLRRLTEVMMAGQATGVLFKLELAPYGYTFVSTGALPGHPRLLEHESRIYARLNRLQGEVVPVHLGLAWLHRGYILPGKARVFHMMLMSWGGEAMADMVATGAGTADLPAEVRRSSQAVWDEGVDHSDERDANRYCFLFEHFQGPGPLEVLAPGKEIPYTASPTTADLSSIPSELLVDIAARPTHLYSSRQV
ncbi:hypothetical protein AK830_g11093 [Neonectria ditissima]|uniref:Uncharacterized protein n=1 Tax=Neonectria ditissima TaxID=78410 RepID=A0A0P7ARX1_9HYPO|nr:hypothetical protein AK830_g11093 [Neonectria ditissima]